jgi:hypothetical protein
MYQKEISPSSLLEALNSGDQLSKIAAMHASIGAPFSIDTIKTLMESADWVKRSAAMLACSGREDIPIEILKMGLNDQNQRVKISAIKSFIGKTPPNDLFIPILLNDDSKVCKAIVDVYKAYDIKKMPILRTFNPIKNVYIRCVGGVTIEAKIPEDAQVRGYYGIDCRTSKIKVIDIIGKLFDEQIAIPRHNMTVVYEISDIIEEEDFDMSSSLIGKGIPFVCSLKEAMEDPIIYLNDISPLNPISSKYYKYRKGAIIHVPN